MSPPLAVLVTLILILAAPRRIPAWATMLAAVLALPLLAGRSLAEASSLWIRHGSDADNLALTGVCASVFVLSSVLAHGGHLDALCELASGSIRSRRLRAVAMPALVGIVPMPGGAAVSAPLIDRAVRGADVPAATKNLLNYWFRHVWEVSWPLYPAVLLAAAYADGGASGFFLSQAGLSAVLILAGFVTLLRDIPEGGEPAGGASRKGMLSTLPILTLCALPFAWPPALGGTLWRQLGPVLIATVVAVATAHDSRGLRGVPGDRRIYAMTLLAFVVQVFGDLVTATGGAAGVVRLLEVTRFPAAVSLAILPFVIGFSTGATLSFVAVAFPIVLPAASRSGVPVVAALVLAYAGGFLGYLTSPVHMCFVLSTRYFNASMRGAYAKLALPLLVFFAAAVVLFLVLGGRFDS